MREIYDAVCQQLETAEREQQAAAAAAAAAAEIQSLQRVRDELARHIEAYGVVEGAAVKAPPPPSDLERVDAPPVVVDATATPPSTPETEEEVLEDADGSEAPGLPLSTGNQAPTASPNTPARNGARAAEVRGALQLLGEATARTIADHLELTKPQVQPVLYTMLQRGDVEQGEKVAVRGAPPARLWRLRADAPTPPPREVPQRPVSGRVRKELERAALDAAGLDDPDDRAAAAAVAAFDSPVTAPGPKGHKDAAEDRLAAVTAEVIRYIGREPSTSRDVAKILIRNQQEVASILRELERRGRAHRAEDGTWHLVETRAAAA